jgi:hypothetical protein
MKLSLPDGDRTTRLGTWSTVLGLGVAAAYVSYSHVYALCVANGEAGATARLTPFTVDGMVFVASMVLLDAAKKRQRSPGIARISLIIGILATMAANILHGLSNGIVGAAISAWPALALVFAFEMGMGMIRRGKRADATVPAGNEDPTITAARLKFAEFIEKNQAPGIRQIMADMHVGFKNAKRIQNALTEGAV